MRHVVAYLTRDELQALLDAPDPRTISGARDRSAMLHLAFAAGLRVSELVALRLDQLDLQSASSIHVVGKGRRERRLPLWRETAVVLKAWLAARPHVSDHELFLNARGRAMTRSGFEYILATHVAAATRQQPSIASKRGGPACVAPHMRHAHAAGDPRCPKGLTLARSRQSSEHRDLFACRPNFEARSTRGDGLPHAQTRTLPTARQAAGHAASRAANQ